jgi:hypothetical protein
MYNAASIGYDFKFYVKQYVSPLDDKPWIYSFEFWHEVEDWVHENCLDEQDMQLIQIGSY